MPSFNEKVSSASKDRPKTPNHVYVPKYVPQYMVLIYCSLDPATAYIIMFLLITRLIIIRLDTRRDLSYLLVDETDTDCIYTTGNKVMHLSMLSPTPPSTGMGETLPRNLIQNFVPRRVGHLT